MHVTFEQCGGAGFAAEGEPLDFFTFAHASEQLVRCQNLSYPIPAHSKQACVEPFLS